MVMSMCQCAERRKVMKDAARGFTPLKDAASFVASSLVEDLKRAPGAATARVMAHLGRPHAVR